MPLRGCVSICVRKRACNLHFSIQALAYLFRASRNTRPVRLLGAGDSFRYGIPMAEEATRRIARAAYFRQVLGADEELGNPKPSDWSPSLRQQPWFISDPKRFADNFPLAVENLLRPTEFRREFFTKMIKPLNGINPGYRHLAKLMMRRLCWTVMTTNFDHNIVNTTWLALVLAWYSPLHQEDTHGRPCPSG